MFKKILIANRGEIAIRIIRTLEKMGISSVAVYSDADRNSPHVSLADEAFHIGESEPSKSYLRGDKILQIAQETGAEAVIPGYGFLSENAEFAEACAKAGVVFIGPTPEQIRDFGLKHTSRELAAKADVPLTPGTGLLQSLDEAIIAGRDIGYPLMLKSTAGGGGIGMTRCADEQQLINAFESVQRQADSFFGNSGIFLERFVDHARHIEVQIFGDGQGNVIALGERDCSLQRRNQKVVEETPAPGISESMRQALFDAAVKLGKSVNYQSAGTLEFIYDVPRENFYFLEVNTRLQVEHPITEMTTGLDLVEWMVKIAAGESPDFSTVNIQPKGAAIEVRIYAEDASKNFQPSPGTLTEVSFPEDIRLDGWIQSGSEVSAFYDPMLAKLIVYAENREQAIAKMQQALADTRLSGIATNLDYLRQVVGDEIFTSGKVSTQALNSFVYEPFALEVINPGTYTTVQDYPGRIGFWDIGVPPSGPMDDHAFRIANRIVGNPESAAGLECTIIGPTLKFHQDAVIALSGAPSPATLDGEAVPFWKAITVSAGQQLSLGTASQGCRIYLAIRGGLDVPDYLGSRSTFALGQFGGHGGRPLRTGDMLPLGRPEFSHNTEHPVSAPADCPASLIPDYVYRNETGPVTWEIAVLYGPHGAPDFFTQDAIEMFFSTDWEVHYNSNRLGIRLNGPKPTWARSDGGEAGLHPSNIHDCEYAIGSINFTGDMPVILTHDGPSLGGFVCPVTIIKAELWKVGQLKPGDRIRFRAVDFQQALNLQISKDSAIANLHDSPLPALEFIPANEMDQHRPILAEIAAHGVRPQVTYRQAGDNYILLEYGPVVLDLRFRLRIHALMEHLKAQPIEGIEELSPGVRSLQIRYDSRQLHQQDLIEALLDIEHALADPEQMQVASRVIYLPMAFEDSATLDAVSRYRQSVKDKAPWLPNNVDFIKRINGLEHRERVRDIIFEASYMVLGLGDVYLGAPCAVPIDPRHRLLTSKYNPARTYTAEGTVGIGGVYMCIYGMDSPGGYQLVGRTLPIWNKFLENSQFVNGEPWLLRFFDQVRFYPVPEQELVQLREDFRHGRLKVHIEETTFSWQEHAQFLEHNADSISEFKARQQHAFEAEVALWSEADTSGQEDNPISRSTLTTEHDGHVVEAHISGNVWKLLVNEGDVINEGDDLLIVEAMKMEFCITAPVSGIIQTTLCLPGKTVNPGEALMVINPH
ncbi:MAG: urea carboxylase [Methylophaga sp.]|nr:urea carboxylase [Methylophaga sp.]